MKRLLSLVLTLLLIISICACGNDGSSVTDPIQTNSSPEMPSYPAGCTHELEVLQTIPATCTEGGVSISVCILCGDQFSQEMPFPGHKFTDASCIAAPICTVCGYTSGSALGHTYVDGVCSHCGDVIPEDVPIDCQHDYVLMHQSAPTCLLGGTMDYQCSKCDHTYMQNIAATGHRFSDATCITPQTCIVCNHCEGTALGHSYQDGKCSRCGEPDPSAPVEVTFTVTIRSDKGKVIEGVTVAVYTNDQSPAATAKTNNKGIATMNILVSQNYRVVLSNIPNGFAAKDSYTFSSTRVNINLSTVSVVSPTDHSKANYKVGSTMGDFTLTDTDGNIYTMSNLLKEKELIILDFWFVNCGPCKAEFPYFEAITEKYDNVQLLTLNHIDSEKDIISLREQMGVTFPMMVENIGFQQGFGISAYPFTVFIDGNGRILKIDNSVFSSQADLEALIDSLLK